MNRYLVPALLLGSLALTSVYMAQRSSEQAQARQLSQSLRRHQYYYQHAIERETEVVTSAVRALDSGLPLQTLERELTEMKAQFDDLHARLERLPVEGRVRERMLQPLLTQLSSEAAELGQLAETLSLEPVAARQRLQEHRHPNDLLAPALQEIGAQYGLPRPKLWRGRPLVS
jgi:hypothetical protein